MDQWDTEELQELIAQYEADGEPLILAVEEYAEDNDFIASEEALSKRFDGEVLPGILEEHGQKGVAFTDTTMVRCAFNDWADDLCRNNEIHDEQLSAYSYVGEFESE